MTRYTVTSALPYANGPQHFGHMVGAYLPADVYVRTLRMQGEDVLFVCGGDEHGVAITIGAERDGKPYEEYVAHWREVIHDAVLAGPFGPRWRDEPGCGLAAGVSERLAAGAVLPHQRQLVVANGHHLLEHVVVRRYARRGGGRRGPGPTTRPRLE